MNQSSNIQAERPSRAHCAARLSAALVSLRSGLEQEGRKFCASFEGVDMHAEEAATSIYRRGLRSVCYHWVSLFRSRGFTTWDPLNHFTPAEYRALLVTMLHDIHKERRPRTDAQRYIRGMIENLYALPNRPKAKAKP